MRLSIPEKRLTRALVARTPKNGAMNLSLETVHFRTVIDNEVLVKVVATGICHSDVWYTTEPVAHGGIYARVLGHEGAGYVVETGSDVTVVEPGDPVLLTLPSCGACYRCKSGHPYFCTAVTNEHLKGEAGVFHSLNEAEYEIHGQFHGQSSFANYTIVKEGAVFNAKALAGTDEKLRLFAPIVCGFQTGAGSVLSVAKAKRTDSVVVIGLGGVGLGAVVAAKIKGCSPIIGIDLHQSRLDAAMKLGATDVLKSVTDSDLPEKIKSLTGGYGASIVVDTTGLLTIIEAGVEAVQDGGKFVHVGIPNPIMAELKISLIKFLGQGKSFMSSKAGDVEPREFLPQMIKWHEDGNMPIDDMMTFYPVDDYEQAFKNMKASKDIKTVLVW